MTWQDSQIVLPVVQTGDRIKQPDLGPASRFDLEKLLPIDLIRIHAKVDDVPSASDEQLEIYRQAALESAEQYTGFVFGGSRTVEEWIDRSLNKRDLRHGFFKFQLEFPAADGIVYLFGSGQSLTLHTKVGGKTVRIPVVGMSLDLSGACCAGPCGPNGSVGSINPGTKVLYRTGYKTMEDIPAGIKLGMLKYCAWCVTHPGDEIVAVRNRTITRSSLVDGTNNVAWASGAIEIWRQYDPENI